VEATKRVALIVVVLSVFGSELMGQTPPTAGPSTRTFTLAEAIDYALANYPAIRAAQEQVTVARAGVSLARTSYLPRADSLWESNRATANNIFGLLLPQSVIPSISGPVLPVASNRSVWGSATGVLFTWEPFDFGYRGAKVDASRSAENLAQADVAVAHLEVAMAAADAFLTLAAAELTVRAAQADVDRREVFDKSVHVLVDNQLRPGADASRSDAEMARARITLIRAQQQEQVSRVALAQALGIGSGDVRIETGQALSPPPESTLVVPALSGHPVAAAQQARVNEVRAEEHILNRTDFPRFYFQSGIFGRGSGADPNGTFATGLNGLGLERENWAAEFTVMFPNLFDFAALRAQKRQEAARERAEAARYDLTLQTLNTQVEQARAALEGARRVAANTPIELEAARASETQSRARYQAGLATIVEVADAQALLVQAEIDDALARLAVWHNLASLAAAGGSLDPFLQLVQQAGGH